jgi:hypothetical protein
LFQTVASYPFDLFDLLLLGPHMSMDQSSTLHIDREFYLQLAVKGYSNPLLQFCPYGKPTQGHALSDLELHCIKRPPLSPLKDHIFLAKMSLLTSNNTGSKASEWYNRQLLVKDNHV